MFSVTPGAVASTSTVIGALVKLLPARSVTTMRRSWRRSRPPTLHVASYGARVACDVREAAAAGLRLPRDARDPRAGVRCVRGEVDRSADGRAVARSGQEAARIQLSTRVVTAALVPELPPASVAFTSCMPSRPACMICHGEPPGRRADRRPASLREQTGLVRDRRRVARRARRDGDRAAGSRAGGHAHRRAKLSTVTPTPPCSSSCPPCR